MRTGAAFLMGIVAGMRSMSAPAAASWAARAVAGAGTQQPLNFMQHPNTPLILSALAAGEIIADKLPGIPSRTKPPVWIFRVASGALAGATLEAEQNTPATGALAGALGALIGTPLATAARARLAKVIGVDWPAALIEDAAMFALTAFALSETNEAGSIAEARPETSRRAPFLVGGGAVSRAG